MKPPAFQFYARDWLSSTLGMPWEVAGVYIHLLAWSWDNGALPNDPEWRARVIGADAARLWAAVSKRWKKTARGWINLRLERQREIQATFSAHAKQAASKRWAYAQAMPASTPRVMPKRSSASASASASSDQDQPRAARAVNVPWKIYRAIAAKVVRESATDDLGELAEAFKSTCAKQGLEYPLDVPRKAIDGALAARARRRA
jgi:uncharacterized protein YdaU (DUF1376 family)